MPHALVVGASGAIGRFLLPRLLEHGYEVTALSRLSHASSDSRVRWLVADLHAHMPSLPAVDLICSLGPLDAFAHWFAQARDIGAPRVIAFGSMSIATKRDSTDENERVLAARLQRAEDELMAAAAARGCDWTVFRPTLIYGAGVDRSLTPIAHFARRWHVIPRLRAASGLRQPVHADDLAAACIAALDNARTSRRTYELGGGEQLSFALLLERVRASLPVRCLPMPIPLGVVRALLRMVQRSGVRMPHAGAIDRLGRDLIADNIPARTDFGWSPRGFHPDADTWIAR